MKFWIALVALAAVLLAAAPQPASGMRLLRWLGLAHSFRPAYYFVAQRRPKWWQRVPHQHRVPIRAVDGRAPHVHDVVLTAEEAQAAGRPEAAQYPTARWVSPFSVAPNSEFEYLFFLKVDPAYGSSVRRLRQFSGTTLRLPVFALKIDAWSCSSTVDQLAARGPSLSKRSAGADPAGSPRNRSVCPHHGRPGLRRPCVRLPGCSCAPGLHRGDSRRRVHFDESFLSARPGQATDEHNCGHSGNDSCENLELFESPAESGVISDEPPGEGAENEAMGKSAPTEHKEPSEYRDRARRQRSALNFENLEAVRAMLRDLQTAEDEGADEGVLGHHFSAGSADQTQRRPIQHQDVEAAFAPSDDPGEAPSGIARLLDMIRTRPAAQAAARLQPNWRLQSMQMGPKCVPRRRLRLIECEPSGECLDRPDRVVAELSSVVNNAVVNRKTREMWFMKKGPAARREYVTVTWPRIASPFTCAHLEGIGVNRDGYIDDARRAYDLRTPKDKNKLTVLQAHLHISGTPLLARKFTITDQRRQHHAVFYRRRTSALVPWVPDRWFIAVGDSRYNLPYLLMGVPITSGLV